jgi:hypothetical protein
VNEQRQAESDPAGRDGSSLWLWTGRALAFDVHPQAREVEVHIAGQIEVVDLGVFEHIGLFVADVWCHNKEPDLGASASPWPGAGSLQSIHDEMDVARGEMGYLMHVEIDWFRRAAPVHVHHPARRRGQQARSRKPVDQGRAVGGLLCCGRHVFMIS